MTPVRQGRAAEAVAAYDRALELTENPVERAHLSSRRSQAWERI